MNVLLIMRQVYYKFTDHIKALRDLGVNVHLITEVERACDDGLFASVHITPYAMMHGHIIDLAKKIKTSYVIDAVITFVESEIILAAEIAENLNLPGLEKSAALISRDKSKQRELLTEHHIPAPYYFNVKRVDPDISCFDNQYPLIVKPTQASLSYGVYLVNNGADLKLRLQQIYDFSKENRLHFHESDHVSFALVEEFLPGEEITLDGVVIDGKFILGGIHNKWRNMGPTFEEDLYAASICQALALKNGMFNVEMRQDNHGVFKVVEFSTRLSGGYCYRHIKSVYGIDMVTLYCKRLLGFPIELREITPMVPTMATCTKWVFGTGKVLRNSSGQAKYFSHYEDYYALAAPGDVLKGLPYDLGCIGRLSLYAPFRTLTDVLNLEQHSFAIMKQLDVELCPVLLGDTLVSG